MSELVLTRRAMFSSGHRYWFDRLSEADNRALFGSWASPFSHGHNYILDVSVGGSIDERTGMVVNIKEIDRLIRAAVLAEFDGRSINDEIEHFREHAPTLENIASYIWSRLDGLPPSVRLRSLRLEEMPTLWVELDGADQSMKISRSYEFAASHRLHSPALSDAENIEVFGKCNNPAGHGHNYVVEVTVSGDPDPKTGMAVNLEELDRVVQREVLDRYDHRNLSEDLPEFRGRVPTSEVVAQEIWRRLESAAPGTLERVRLHETARNTFEVSRD